jgi:tRNA(Ile2) C34 agmatinyltransferase TiaS
MEPMESLGRGKGYQCKKCKYHIVGGVGQRITLASQAYSLLLEPPIRSVRHLTRPIKRFGVVNRRRHPLIQGWISKTSQK